MSVHVAADTMGFPIMLEQIVPEGLGNPDCRKMEKPPEISPFFTEGEELWDVKKAYENAHQEKALPEWVIWQPRTKIVIAKGAPSALWPIHRRMNGWDGPDLNALLKIEIFEAPADRSSWTKASKSIAVLSWTNMSGYRTSAKVKDAKDYTLEVESEVFADGTSPWFNGQIVVLYGRSGKPTFSLASPMIPKIGEPLWLARFELEGKEYDLVCSGTIERSDGGPRSDHVLVIEENEVRRIGLSLHESESKKIGDGMMVSTSFPSAELWKTWIEHSNEGPNQVDPFALVAPGDPANKLSPFTEIPVPEELIGTMGHTALGVGKVADPIASMPLSEDFVAYDLRRGKLVFFTKNKNLFLSMDRLFLPTCRLPIYAVPMTLNGGRLTLLGLANHKSRMEVKEGSETLWSLGIEPTPDGESVESVVDFKDTIRGVAYNGSLTFLNGREKEVMKSEKAGLTIRADLIRVYE